MICTERLSTEPVSACCGPAGGPVLGRAGTSLLHEGRGEAPIFARTRHRPHGSITGMPWHPVERAALAHALRDVGPDAPTLCTGWRSRHLAAHIVLRDSAPLVAAGPVVAPLHPYAERRVAELAD